jgi:hypothetical protein
MTPVYDRLPDGPFVAVRGRELALFHAAFHKQVVAFVEGRRQVAKSPWNESEWACDEIAGDLNAVLLLLHVIPQLFEYFGLL